MMMRVLAPLLMAALLSACASVTNPVTGERELSVMDEKAEITEGTKAHAQVLQEYPPLDNPALQAYVNDLGQRLAAQSHRANLKWTFTVLDSQDVNAFALPGGYVYITRGIMVYLDSEADLAGVLGHEIGHVTARHGAQRATSQARAQAGVAAATVLGVLAEVAGVRDATRAANQLSQVAAAGLIASYGREQELQADRLGAEYLARNRFNPSNMVDVIQVLKDQERFAADAARAAGRAAPTGGGWLASHPSSDQRLQSIQGTADQLAASVPGGWADEGRARYLKAIEGLAYGDSKEQGVVRGRQYFHEPLGITLSAPQGWRIANGADDVTFTSPERDAALVLRLVPEATVKRIGTDHEALLRNALGATEGRTEKLTLGGSLPATYFNGKRADAKGAVGPLEATLVNGPGGRIYLLARMASTPQARDRVRATLREAELGFRAMTAADRTAAKPWRIKLVPYPAGGFAALARNAPGGEAAEGRLRLLNNAYGRGNEPKPGQLVKVIE